MKQNKLTRQLLLCLFFPLILATVASSCTKDNMVTPASPTPATGLSTIDLSASLAASTATTSTGSILHMQWSNVAGTSLSNIPFKNTPNVTEMISGLQLTPSAAGNVGNVIRGYVVAPQTGSYTFWICANSNAQLLLSNSDDPTAMVSIATLSGGSGYLEWNEKPSQKSKAIKLTAGQKYFIQVMQKQGTGSSYLAVGWTLPNGQLEAPIPGSRLIPYKAVATTLPTYKPASVINLNGVHDTTISGLSIAGGNVAAITLNHCYNVHITGNKLYNSTDVGIHLYQCYNVTIDNNYFTNVSTGVYVQGVGITTGGIVINQNQFLNMMGPLPRGQFVQFNNVTGPGCSISNNLCENIFGQSYPEDAISLYMSNGTAASPIMVSGNSIRGGGPSTTGGGIILGDAGGSYQTVESNVLVNPGQYGIGIASGTDMQVLNNKIFATKNVFTNVGVTVWNQYSNACAIINVSGNQVNWTAAGGYANPDWNDGNCGTVAGWNTNSWAANLTASILPLTLITDK
jgi:parallel beta-helix repeat protein